MRVEQNGREFYHTYVNYHQQAIKQDESMWKLALLGCKQAKTFVNSDENLAGWFKFDANTRMCEVAHGTSRLDHKKRFNIIVCKLTNFGINISDVSNVSKVNSFLDTWEWISFVSQSPNNGKGIYGAGTMTCSFPGHQTTVNNRSFSQWRHRVHCCLSVQRWKNAITVSV